MHAQCYHKLFPLLSCARENERTSGDIQERRQEPEGNKNKKTHKSAGI